MKLSDTQNQRLHKRLPIDDEEQILAVFRHHWFAYFSLWVVGIVSATAILVLAAVLTMPASGAGQDPLSNYRGVVLIGAGILAALIVLFFAVPVWLRSQEQLVLTDEALLQILQPSLFASKISQLSLQHVADASVRRDFFGTILGYGKVTIETPGEQDNYDFTMVSSPETVVKQIITAHEEFTAALEGGRMPTKWRGVNTAQQAPVQLSAEEYQKFLDYQRSVGAPQTGQTQPPTAAAPQSPTPEPPPTNQQQ